MVKSFEFIVLKEASDIISAMNEEIEAAKDRAQVALEQICARARPRDAFQTRLHFLQSTQGSDGWQLAEEPEYEDGVMTYIFVSNFGFSVDGESYLNSDSRYRVNVGDLQQEDHDVFVREILLCHYGVDDDDDDDDDDEGSDDDGRVDSDSANVNAS
jgi:hypothetical protein